MDKLSPQEEELMLIIWHQNGGVVRSFIPKMVDDDTPYTTVASIAKNLQRKGYVNSEMFGNTYRYTPRISENEYKATFMSGFIGNYFENSYKEMVSFFAKKQKISAEELQEIIQLIEENDE
jgi:predicted transcriptional regulator